MASQQQSSKTPLHIRDRLRTPGYIFDYFHEKFSFDIDLCAEKGGNLCALYFDEETDGLAHRWPMYGGAGWCNPPFSSQEAWIRKAIYEGQFGFVTVMLLPVFNGQAYWQLIADNATQIHNIIGRIAFISPEDFTKSGGRDKPDVYFKEGDEIPGNTAGTCIVVFGGDTLPMGFLSRDNMRKGEAE